MAKRSKHSKAKWEKLVTSLAVMDAASFPQVPIHKIKTTPLRPINEGFCKPGGFIRMKP